MTDIVSVAMGRRVMRGTWSKTESCRRGVQNMVLCSRRATKPQFTKQKVNELCGLATWKFANTKQHASLLKVQMIESF